MQGGTILLRVAQVKEDKERDGTERVERKRKKTYKYNDFYYRALGNTCVSVHEVSINYLFPCFVRGAIR